MAKKKKDSQKAENDKIKDLKTAGEDAEGQYLTTNQGLRINDDQNSLKAGERGPWAGPLELPE